GSTVMALHPLAGTRAPSRMLIDVARLEREYYERKPDPHDPRQLVRFGTSGHRGTSFDGTLTETHILAIAQAICDYRRSQDTDVTGWVQDRANQLVRADNAGVKRVPLAAAVKAATIRAEDFVLPYVRDLGSVIDMDSIRAAGLKLGVDPLGGAALHYWESIEEVFRLNITVVNPGIDPTFAFMTLDHDGKIRMDCSSPYAMAGLVKLKDRYQVAFGNDPDADRHGIVTPSAGLMNPN